MPWRCLSPLLDCSWQWCLSARCFCVIPSVKRRYRPTSPVFHRSAFSVRRYFKGCLGHQASSRLLSHRLYRRSRSGEGRVGEECRSRGSADHLKKKKKKKTDDV